MTHAIELKEPRVLYKPDLYHWQKDGIHFFLDGASPHWIALDETGAKILDWVNGKNSFGEIVRLYAQCYQTDLAKSWLHAHSFLREALASGMVAFQPIQTEVYSGRSQYLKAHRLKELWVHLTQTCNLSCTHCLVASNPQGAIGPSTDFYLKVMTETDDLGVERYYFTGGEPFIRKDIFELIRTVTEQQGKELIVLTNATLFEGERAQQLKNLSREKLKFQVSLDGTQAQTNDAIRGQGVFEKASAGLKILSALGFETSLTAVVTRANLKELEDLPQLAKKLGAKSIHLMWLHNRGRILKSRENAFPSVDELLHLARKVKKSADELGILFDNVESLKLRVNGKPGVKYDLGNLCWETLCLYLDGHLYPSAAMAGHAPLSLGMLNGKNVRSLWLESEVAQKIRSASVIQKSASSNDPFRYLTGGGDIEHSYFFSTNGSEGSFTAEDPYYALYVGLMQDLMVEIASSKKKNFNSKSGFNAPVIVHAMGADAVTCSEEAQNWLESEGSAAVRLLHSNCVLSFDVEKPYKALQKFYGKAAEKPQAELCCPIRYDADEISHIPQAVIDRFYGCGSPILTAQVKSGETVLDLGSGAGIDCFIAARKVGRAGKVIGVDMTDQMLEVAAQSKKIVAQNLGYDVVEFKRGYLENIPAQDRSVDLVTSNCVINLSPDKKKVFAEIWRILKDTGRFVVADIVSERPVPLSLQAHQDLWGECISGSLSEEEFLSHLERAGFYGISILKKSFWKEVEGTKFYSMTVRGFKFEKKAGCKFVGQKAVYLGPYKAAMDEEGHLFPRGEAIEICTDTAEKLKSAPYSNQFAVHDPKLETAFKISVDPSDPEQEASQTHAHPSGESCCGSAGCC